MSSSRSSDPSTESPPDRTPEADKQREVPSDHVVVGRVLGPWGRHGELKLQLHTNFPDRFASGAVVFLDEAPVTVQRSRPYKTGLLVKLGGVNGRGEASRLRDAYLTVPSDKLPELDDSNMSVEGAGAGRFDLLPFPDRGHGSHDCEGRTFARSGDGAATTCTLCS